MDKDQRNQEKKRNLRLVEKYDSDDYSRFAAPDYAESAFDSEQSDNLYYINRGMSERELLDNSGISGATEEEAAKTNFRGVGPKGYIRSDDKIYEDVCENLMRHSGIDASNIIVKVVKGIVNLSGKIDSKGAKNLAQAIVENISGVKEVTNEMAVIRSDLKMGGPEGVTKKDLGIT